jgi:inosine-uridine nucleoside N-ribohydrolase
MEKTLARRINNPHPFSPTRLLTLILCLLAFVGFSRQHAQAAAEDTPANQPQNKPIELWLDVDTANGITDVDDGLMLIQAFHSPALKIRGTSSVFGNARQQDCDRLTRYLTRRFGPEGVQVYAGAMGPNDLGKTNPAVEGMAQALKAGPMTIAAVGPVTNVGSLLKLHPELAPRVQRVVVVAGRQPGLKFTHNNKRFSRDFNFELDPDAMQVILDSKVPLVMAGWEVSSKVWLSRELIDSLAQTGGSGAWIAQTSGYWLDRWEKAISPKGFNPYDTLAVGYLIDPTGFKGFWAHAKIESLPDDAAGIDTATDRREKSARVREKPYLLATPVAEGQTSNVYYLTDPPADFAQTLVSLLSGKDRPDRANTPMPAAGAPDHSLFAQVLQKYVSPSGMVNYKLLKSEPELLDQYITLLLRTDIDALGEKDKLALLINAYNAFTLKLIIDHYPVRSIKDIPAEKRWKDVRWRLGRHTYSLDQIEHELIRPVFNEPRIHFALVCAAVDCPPLRNEPFEAAKLDMQLDDQTRRVHKNGSRWFKFDNKTGVLKLTSLYKWYGKDFVADGINILPWAAKYNTQLSDRLKQTKAVHVEFLNYNWDLNEQESKK